MLVNKLLIIIIGIAQGIAVATGFAAFITILEIIYRLVQITETVNYIRIYEKCLISALPITSLFLFLNLHISIGKVIVIFVGLFMGIFIGLLASALAEVLNVIPVLVNKLDLINYVNFILISLILGKVLGSLVYWLYVV